MCQQMRGVVALCVVPAEAVERDENEIMLLLGPRRVGAVVDIRKRERGIETGFLSLGRERPESQCENKRERGEDRAARREKSHRDLPRNSLSHG